ncbi:CAF17-like 4Fe-4S cluster assembly/insertion protein YgfZ [Oryzifoliimicrobium ureilyticus]|uniref:CAF17-like 4Fe-4S cluster assembly/insertion protein YgfZ n=1 Tax=Oryzifoliimicrobium ureilyticus TaxID=3113724 RepID=UPI0030764797
MTSVFLKDRVTIEVGGKDASDFLNSIITTDVSGLAAGEALPGALLTPQGKILFDFLIWKDQNIFILETDRSQRDALLKRLTMYCLRAAVDLRPGAAEGVMVSWNQALDGTKDLRFAKAGVELTRNLCFDHMEGDDVSAYDALRISAGIVRSGADYALQDAFPHDVMMDLNGGVSFSKGCYVGQEVVSRMKHRSTARRRVVIVSALSTLPVAGTPITANAKPIGVIGSVVDTEGLSVARIDRAGEAMAAGIPLMAGDLEVRLELPAWSGLSFPTSVDEASA